MQGAFAKEHYFFMRVNIYIYKGNDFVSDGTDAATLLRLALYQIILQVLGGLVIETVFQILLHCF